MSEPIGILIKRLRKMNGFSQDELAKKLNVKRSTYAYRERNSAFTAEDLKLISELFSVSLDALLKGEISHPIKFPTEPKNEVQTLNQPKFQIKNDDEENFAVLTNRERKHLKKYRYLPNDLKELVEKYIDSIIENTED